MDLSLITVSWNVRDLLRACLESIVHSSRIGLPGAKGPAAQIAGAVAGRTNIRCEVFVVDNASQDGSQEMVRREYPWVRLIANSANLGFTRGNNQALTESSGRYVLFLNPDTRLHENALAVMIDYMDEHPQSGALGPRLRYSDGSVQSSRRRFPTLGTALFESTPLAWLWPNNPWARRYRMADTPDGQELAVDWVVGAALLARREVLEQIGGFDESYFMYSEELDWCRRAANAGWGTVYLPSAEVIHCEGKSSEQVVAARHIHFQTSKLRYFRKYHGALAANVLRIFLLASFAGEWLIEASKWLLGSKRPLRRERLSAYALLLRTKLRSI